MCRLVATVFLEFECSLVVEARLKTASAALRNDLSSEYVSAPNVEEVIDDVLYRNY